MLPKTVILLGPPGSGKDTQAFAVAKEFGYFVLVTGDLFRAEVAHGTKVGQKMREIMESGGLLPAEMVGGVVADELERHKSVIEANGLLFDGYPRTEPEIADADELVDRYNLRPDLAILLDVNEAELLRRLVHRGRAGDDKETALKRLETYRLETEPVVQHYRQLEKLLTIDGSGSPEAVSANVIKSLKEYDAKN